MFSGNFTGIKTDTIVRYQLPNETTERFNRVTEVLSDGSISLGCCCKYNWNM